MFEYRITKYDPAFRDRDGAYRRNEWTSFSDIGKSFDGKPLSKSEYLRAESAYVTVALAFLQEFGASSLVVRGLESPLEPRAAIADGDEITLMKFKSVLPGILREEFWCKFEAPDSFIHIGYDYYMYIGVPSPCPNSERLAKNLGLFVEPFQSPYGR